MSPSRRRVANLITILIVGLTAAPAGQASTTIGPGQYVDQGTASSGGGQGVANRQTGEMGATATATSNSPYGNITGRDKASASGRSLLNYKYISVVTGTYTVITVYEGFKFRHYVKTTGKNTQIPDYPFCAPLITCVYFSQSNDNASTTGVVIQRWSHLATATVPGPDPDPKPPGWNPGWRRPYCGNSGAPGSESGQPPCDTSSSVICYPNILANQNNPGGTCDWNTTTGRFTITNTFSVNWAGKVLIDVEMVTDSLAAGEATAATTMSGKLVSMYLSDPA